MRVLVGVDDDPVFEDVLGCLRWCVRVGPSDEVVVLHAIPVLPWSPHTSVSDAEGGEDWKSWGREADVKADRLLSEATQLLARWDIEAKAVKCRGHAAKELLRVAGERAADLIVVGTRAKDQHGFLVGSVSHKVKALAQTDVLVVRPRAPLEPGRFRALLTVDGSPESSAAVESFVTKLHAERADVLLLHVLDVPPQTALEMFEDEPIDPNSLSNVVHEHVDHVFSYARAILAAHDIEPTVEIRKGEPAPIVLAAAARHRAHVIVMGSRGLTGLSGVLLGSVTQRVVRHGAASVLIARSRPPRVSA
jgi:nucleotide-binding universal stress UspA family protein